jgi:hypothetical protein
MLDSWTTRVWNYIPGTIKADCLIVTKHMGYDVKIRNVRNYSFHVVMVIVMMDPASARGHVLHKEINVI